jgi:SPOR domain
MRFQLAFVAIVLLPALLAAQDGGSTPVRTFEPYRGEVKPAQVDTPPSMAAPRTGKVELHADPEVDDIMRSYTEHKHAQKGFRVQIVLGDRKTAEDTKRAFLQKNPDIPAYMSWLAPNWRLRVGDFRTRLEAERLLRDLKVNYPGSYIVPDEIEMPRLATEP